VVVGGNHDALDEVYSLAYEELRRLARAVLRSDRAASLTPTTLVNEAWIKLARSPEVANTSPLHFRRIAGRAMRQVLVEAARRKQSEIRGGGQPHVAFDESLTALPPVRKLSDLLELDAALSALGTISPRQAQLVEGRFFGGLSWAESAESLAISESTVMREWRAARAWLGLELRRGQQRDGGVP
jgi:RNA polymerase sigma factor (TIGR02999 family)